MCVTYWISFLIEGKYPIMSGIILYSEATIYPYPYPEVEVHPGYAYVIVIPLLVFIIIVTMRVYMSNSLHYVVASKWLIEYPYCSIFVLRNIERTRFVDNSTQLMYTDHHMVSNSHIFTMILVEIGSSADPLIDSTIEVAVISMYRWGIISHLYLWR
jgi:hypothetical protein